MSKVTRFFVGVDLHKTIIQICVLDQGGNIVEERRRQAPDLVAGMKVIGSLMKYKKHGRIAVEAIGVNRWFVNNLLEHGFEVVVCDPTKLNLKMLGRKTDRRDALEIARRLMLGDIDRNATTYYPSDEEYGKRKVVRSRHKLNQMRQGVINQIRSILNAYKITGFGSDLTTKKSIRQLWRMEWPTEELAVVGQVWITTLEHLGEAMAHLNNQLAEMARDDKVSGLKNDLPSVGSVTATTLFYELGDVTRFKHSRSVANYGGLVPRVCQSADTAHHGKLTKRGNRVLRHVLGEWAVRLLSSDERVARWAKPRLRRSHKNKVRMALARRLLIGVYKMLRTGEAFSMERCLGM